jgi:hypothetical protein
MANLRTGAALTSADGWGAVPETGGHIRGAQITINGNTVGDLKTAIMNVRMARANAIPIGELDTQLRRDKFGEKPGPKFRIVDWKLPASAADEAPKPLAQEMNDDLPFN